MNQELNRQVYSALVDSSMADNSSQESMVENLQKAWPPVTNKPDLMGPVPGVPGAVVAYWLQTHESFRNFALRAQGRADFLALVSEARQTLLAACQKNPLIASLTDRLLSTEFIDDYPDDALDDDGEMEDGTDDDDDGGERA
jgi:hypothetical protein